MGGAEQIGGDGGDGAAKAAVAQGGHRQADNGERHRIGYGQRAHGQYRQPADDAQCDVLVKVVGDDAPQEASGHAHKGHHRYIQRRFGGGEREALLHDGGDLADDHHTGSAAEGKGNQRHIEQTGAHYLLAVEVIDRAGGLAAGGGSRAGLVFQIALRYRLDEHGHPEDDHQSHTAGDREGKGEAAAFDHRGEHRREHDGSAAVDTGDDAGYRPALVREEAGHISHDGGIDEPGADTGAQSEGEKEQRHRGGEAGDDVAGAEQDAAQGDGPAGAELLDEGAEYRRTHRRGDDRHGVAEHDGGAYGIAAELGDERGLEHRPGIGQPDEEGSDQAAGEVETSALIQFFKFTHGGCPPGRIRQGSWSSG